MEWTRFNLQRASVLDSNFWFHVQTHGFRRLDNSWCNWRKPKSPELKSMVNLALAHGSKGIIFLWFDSYGVYSTHCSSDVYIECIVDENGDPEINEGDTLYVTLKDKIIPRLKGILGNTLLNLDYTGVYLPLRRYITEPNGPSNTASTVDTLYLTLTEYSGENPPPQPINFHAGFFESPNQTPNNHFLLTNLITTNSKWVNIEVGDDESVYSNTRFRNVEPEYGFDTTFTNSFSIDMQFPPGEGYLFQVAPVVKYGGNLIYNETISAPTTLIDDMVIQNGATLIVNAEYNCYGNITLNGGNIFGNGKLIFQNNKRITVAEGTSEIYGSNSQDPLEIDFSVPHSINGIQVLQNANFRVWNCIIRNAGFGITVHSNTNYFRASNVQFYDCSDGGITISGPLSLTPIISLCQFSDLSTGLIAANLSEINIQYNQFINNDNGINLVNVTNPYINNNSIVSEKKSLLGIFLESCNGVIRENSINGHTNSIHLGNSSPDIGVNVITNNLYHGIYVGAGSLPKMDARLFYDPPSYYPIAGYNQIWENGGTKTGGPIDNDGSEIYFNNSNAILQKGCNSIYDDRAGGEHPPYNTMLLMNGTSFGIPINIKAEGNFWSDNPQYPLEERFGNLIVDYDPFLEEPCEIPGGGGEELFVKSSAGEIIDTLYPVQLEIGSPSSTDLLYAIAEEKLISADYEGAEVIYNQIINGNDSLDIKLAAYRRLYDIGKLSSKPESYFNNLTNAYSSLIPLTNDSLQTDIFNQLSNLSLVGEEEYIQAIGEFDDVIQQNPGSEKAVYAEIDAITTALLVEGEDSTLHKGRLGKYLVKTSGDYNKRVSEILRKNFGSNAKESEKDLLPTEYTLYQNYPNPFNPVTTIKYDLPNASDASLIIYDILGRKVKELVNTKQQPGRYEIKFDASNLASGVYIYQLIADNPSTGSGQRYINAKKMILLK